MARKLPLSILYTGASLHDEEILRLTNETPNNLDAVREGTILRSGESAALGLGWFTGLGTLAPKRQRGGRGSGAKAKF